MDPSVRQAQRLVAMASLAPLQHASREQSHLQHVRAGPVGRPVNIAQAALRKTNDRCWANFSNADDFFLRR